MKEESLFHIPVMLYEALEYLEIKSDGTYVDGTLGGGGHSLEIAKNLSKKGILFSLDWDQDAIEYVENLRKKERFDCKWKLINSNFSKLKEVLEEEKLQKIDGIIFDLGVSSYQLEKAERGFSYKKQAELDMRMDRNLGVKAKDLVNGLYEKELAKLIFTYGEEPGSRRIAKAIVEERKISPIETTLQLSQVIQKVVPFKARRKSAMRVFQALRIAVNDEINNLQSGLPQALDALAAEGRCVVISFHSLEDRVVKNVFKDYEERKIGKILFKKPVLPTSAEVMKNPRARSAKMRIFEKF